MLVLWATTLILLGLLLADMKNYSDETVGQCIAMLLHKLDEVYGEGMHWYGQTPDWYVAAAAVSCDIEDNNGVTAKMIANIVEEQRV